VSSSTSTRSSSRVVPQTSPGSLADVFTILYRRKQTNPAPAYATHQIEPVGSQSLTSTHISSCPCSSSAPWSCPLQPGSRVIESKHPIGNPILTFTVNARSEAVASARRNTEYNIGRVLALSIPPAWPVLVCVAAHAVVAAIVRGGCPTFRAEQGMPCRARKEDATSV
jgi:hypothetical protein